VRPKPELAAAGPGAVECAATVGASRAAENMGVVIVGVTGSATNAGEEQEH